jgi:two-component system, OmpR family, sensor histidine kinase VicK
MTADRSALGGPGPRGWRFVIATLAGLLIGVAVAGIAALALTVQVGDVVNNALRNDIELEDEADDLRAAVLDVRHYHRNLVFTGPTRTGLAEFDQSYAALLEELDELEAVPVSAPGVIAPSELRVRARAYYDAYRPSVELYATDQAAFDAASDDGLAALAELEAESQRLEDVAEALSNAALQEVRDTIDSSILTLLVILIGVGAVGLALAVASVRVVGEQRRLYTAQRDSSERLAHALRARTDFIADASHELRTPLTVLRGNAEVGLAAGPADCGHEPVLREIVAESERMTRLVEDLLLLARFDAGAMRLETHEVDVEPWLADVAARGEMLARKRGVVLAPSLRGVGRARLDTRRLDQAVMVLLDNATKYSPPGGTVRLEAFAAGESLVLRVIDHGRGIPGDALPFIFERFNRGDRSRGEHRSGAGLGLSIAQAIVKAHGGSISAQSRVGQGTMMAITIPRATTGSGVVVAPPQVVRPTPGARAAG